MTESVINLQILDPKRSKTSVDSAMFTRSREQTRKYIEPMVDQRLPVS